MSVAELQEAILSFSLREAESHWSFNYICFLVIVAVAVYLYRRNGPPWGDFFSPPQPPKPRERTIVAEEDPFLQQIISETNRIDLKVDTMKQQHEREIKQQFTDSKRIKEQLATFAVRRGLNTALNELWSEINCLGGAEEHFEKGNTLKVNGGYGSEKNIRSVEFTHGTQRFKIIEKDRDSDSHRELFFFEDGEEVFATKYNSKITTFKRKGNWAKVLLEYYEKILIKSEKDTHEYNHHRGEEIKSRFKE